MLPRTRTCHSQPVTRNTSERRNGPTSNGFAKWSTPLSPHLSLQQLEGWETRQHRSTNAWPRCCRRSGKRPIASHCAGCDAGWPSLYCAVRFKLSEAPGPPVVTQPDSRMLWTWSPQSRGFRATHEPNSGRASRRAMPK